MLVGSSRRSAAVRPSPVAVLALLAWLASGCAPTYHRAPAYRYDPLAADRVETRARDACRARRAPDALPKGTFYTDGCSWFLDAWPWGTQWQACCVEHDMAYWCGGGSFATRRQADARLRQCVAKEAGPLLGAVMGTAASAAGWPWMPFYWRWGYGHPMSWQHDAPE